VLGVEVHEGAVSVDAEAAPFLRNGVAGRGKGRDRIVGVFDVRGEVVQAFAAAGEYV
jgi:hypothetical protein